MENKTRRGLIVSLGVGVTISTAGCLNNGDSGSENSSGSGGGGGGSGGGDGPSVGERETGGGDSLTEGGTDGDGENSSGSDNESEENVEFRYLSREVDCEWEYNTQMKEGYVEVVEGRVPAAGRIILNYGTLNEPESVEVSPPLEVGDRVEFSWTEKSEGNGIHILWRHDGEESIFSHDIVPESLD